ncbi:MAG: hypothetical protein D3M94_18395 [Rhodocyclales bacterium GT-UBC]|nr:MAG: hypothetical protein D3M94_18395 [Rhodocyclales bacterium GT-UBC]
MARFGLRNRLAKLENRRNKQGTNRVLFYSPADRAQHPASDLQGMGPTPHLLTHKSAAAGQPAPLPGRYMLVCDFGTQAEWEEGLKAQQLALLAKASSVGKQSTNKGE